MVVAEQTRTPALERLMSESPARNILTADPDI
jgi:hypothetical protein